MQVYKDIDPWTLTIAHMYTRIGQHILHVLNFYHVVYKIETQKALNM